MKTVYPHRTIAIIGVALLLLALPIHALKAEKGEASLAKGILRIQSGDYSIEFREDRAWTMRSLSFRNMPLIVPTGFNGAVLNFSPDAAGGNPWIGSGHGGEEVLSVTLKVDGNEQALSGQLKAVKGHDFRLLKQSRLGPLHHRSEIRVTPTGIEESAGFKIEEGDSAAGGRINYLYIFMHCFSPEMTLWRAALSGGSFTEGSFPRDNKFQLKKDISALAVYSEAKEIGAVVVYPKPYEGAPGFSNALWSRPVDCKHYLRVIPKAEGDSESLYHCRITGFSTSSKEWHAEIAKIMEAQ